MAKDKNKPELTPFDEKIKNSIQLPFTEFPMRGNLPVVEPERLKSWDSIELYQKMSAKNRGKKTFIMTDGPPYANGNLHLGHVLNKVLKDVIIKYKSMKGFDSPFIPGWDCHGLPIELKVTKALGKKRKDMTDSEVRELCRKEALTWVNTQKEQFIRLGILADWEKPYLTLQPEFEAEEVRVLAQILENGTLYRGEKPVNWCPTLQTALAAAEVEYADHKSPSIYVKFELSKEEIQSHKDLNLPQDKPVYFVIWTTTPWTLPANNGISLNAKFDYGVYKTSQDDYIILAKELSEKVAQDCDLQLNLVSTHKGEVFERMQAEHPFMDRKSLVILGDHVTLEAGTGCVHTAPGHGLDDYNVGLKYDLPVLSPVDPAGRFTSEVPKYEGLKIWDGNKVIIEDLKQSGHLIGYKEIVHSYPHNPRSKTPLIFRSTPQWFIQMDGDQKLREKALDIAENQLQYAPNWGKQRLTAMIGNSPDWCVSRQRAWGVPIPVFYCENCGDSYTSPELMRQVADKMENSGQGIEAYFSGSSKDFIGDHACQSCGHKEFNKGTDILDVWFDSGSVHSAVQKKRSELKFPADIYLEGSDQHRGWFQTSLMSSVAAYGEAPYKALVTHGFVTDADGYKMSKSKGNVIDPAVIVKQFGAEILRLWVTYEDYGQDITVSEEIFKRISETYRRIRNTIRFLLGNLNDFNHETDKVAYDQLTPLDQWALHELNQLVEKCTSAYDSYNFYKVYHNLNQFFTVEMSAIYLDILKDRLYTWKKEGQERRSSQTVLFELLTTLNKLMAPILSFIAEEAYMSTPGSHKESIFLEDFPEFKSEWHNPQLAEKFKRLRELRDKINGKGTEAQEGSSNLETLRKNKVIGSSLDAIVTIECSKEWTELLIEFQNHSNHQFFGFLEQFLIVSKVIIKTKEGEKNSLHIHVVPAHDQGWKKCERCWHYSEDLVIPKTFEKEQGAHAALCSKCISALE
ncbi:MAG: isoleucine--tRNA ligase [Bdellovibrionales bacterium]|nr:isoleucine--tRNA ligase [Bdellovibrionales bacterium]